MEHMTKDGKIMNIEEMEDSHLINTINFNIRQLEMSKNIINNKNEDKFFNKINNIKINKNMAYRFIDDFNNKIPYYIYEAMLRSLDITNIIKRLTDIIGRNSKIDIKFNNEIGYDEEIIF